MATGTVKPTGELIDAAHGHLSNTMVFWGAGSDASTVLREAKLAHASLTHAIARLELHRETDYVAR